jgi:hypothetical protein
MSRKRKIIVAVSLAIVVIISFLAYSQSRFGQSLNTVNQGDTSWNPFYEPKPVLTVDIQESSHYWYRSPTTDLPEYVATLVIVVRNIGDASAENTEVSVSADGTNIGGYSVGSLQPQGQYSDSVTINLDFDSQKSISANVACSSDSKSASLILNAHLPRSFDSNIAKLYITPEESSVVRLKNQIINDKFFLTPNWMAIRDWVADNVEYRYDSAVYGEDEHWQLPKETIQKRTGDCEDFSILLCSLLRADGWEVDSVYVMMGEQNGSHHAWVQIIWGGIHYVIEPQANGLSTVIGDFFSLSGYDAENKFNDASYRAAG